MTNCNNLEFNVKINYTDKDKTIDKLNHILLSFLLDNNFKYEDSKHDSERDN